MSCRIAVIDYHKGNLKSVERGIISAGGDAFITDDAAAIARADALVLPGVGSFADAAASLRTLGQMEVIRDRIAQGTPFLGICLGMHLMFEEGTEGAPDDDDENSSHNAQGLAILPGVVSAMPRVDGAGKNYKVPHVGWNALEVAESGVLAGANSSGGQSSHFESPLLQGIEPGEFFYFIHGYIAPDSPCTITTTTHSVAFPSAVAYNDTAFGVQFHPEKSSDAGGVLLRNFIAIAKGA